MKFQTLAIDLVRIDCDTQSRIRINDETVADYAELLDSNDGEWPFPDLIVFHDGTDYYLADGFHRYLAAQHVKRGSIPCQVRSGTSLDARIFGMTANDANGLRMSQADKRHCVEWLLDNYSHTQAEIAEMAGVTPRTVRRIVADRKDANRTLSGPDGGSTPLPQGEDGPTDREATEEPQEQSPQSHLESTEPTDGRGEMTDEERAKLVRQSVREMIAKAVRGVEDYHDLKPNRKQCDGVRKLLQQASENLW